MEKKTEISITRQQYRVLSYYCEPDSYAAFSLYGPRSGFDPEACVEIYTTGLSYSTAQITYRADAWAPVADTLEEWAKFALKQGRKAAARSLRAVAGKVSRMGYETV